VLPLGMLEVAELEPMSVLVPELELLVEPLAVPAPMEVPLPVVVSVLPGVVVVLLAVLPVVSVDGVVLEVVEDVELSVDAVPALSCLPQALRDRAAIRARAAHCAIGDLIIRNSLRVYR